MRRDARGLAVTAGTDDAVSAIDAFAHAIVRVTAGAEQVLAAAARHPDVPLLQLDAAALHLFALTYDGDRVAAAYLARAAAGPPPTAREARLAAALAQWHQHAYGDAAATLESLTTAWPDDLLAAKLCEFLYYVRGQQAEGARFLAHAERLRARHGGDPDLLAMLAFARALCGDGDGAEAAAQQALAADPCTPWADHALSHVWLRRGAVAPALAHLTRALPGWAQSNRVIWAHNAWHLALHHLEQLDVAAARALCAEVIWRPQEDLGGIALDAIALHWRAEMAGLESDPPWAAIAARLAPHAAECFMPFASAQAAFALARAGHHDALAALRAAVRAEAGRDTPDVRRAWAPLGRALVEACAALGRGDSAHAVALLAPVIDAVAVGGGSDAQCDLFRLAYARALLDTGRAAEARARLTALWGERPRTPLEQQWWARCTA